MTDIPDEAVSAALRASRRLCACGTCGDDKDMRRALWAARPHLTPGQAAAEIIMAMDARIRELEAERDRLVESIRRHEKVSGCDLSGLLDQQEGDDE